MQCREAGHLPAQGTIGPPAGVELQLTWVRSHLDCVNPGE